jgi:hypothetical protein
VSGDGGPATSANFGNPSSVVLDNSGNIFICCGDGRVRKVSTSGIITTVAGNGSSDSFKGDGGSALVAEIDAAYGIAVDVAGDIYISDAGANRIRKVGLDGVISTVGGGGNGCTGQTDSLGDGCPFSHNDSTSATKSNCSMPMVPSPAEPSCRGVCFVSSWLLLPPAPDIRQAGRSRLNRGGGPLSGSRLPA